jgi:type 1 fimbriae regulatory protein FimB/type 1 fimbriae regulatory protein FimE
MPKKIPPKSQPSFMAIIEPSATAKPKKRKNSPPPRIANVAKRSREYLTPSEVKELRKAAKNASDRHSLRDELIVVMTYRHALRVSELCNMKWDQVHFKDGKLYVSRAKNGDPSVHYLEGDEIRMLRKIERDYPGSPFVFVSQRGGPLSLRTVHWLIARAGEIAGFPFSVHPHMLRHAKGYQLASKGIDTRAIQGYMGHKNIQHTVLYTQLDPGRFKGFGKD